MTQASREHGAQQDGATDTNRFVTAVKVAYLWACCGGSDVVSRLLAGLVD